MTIKTKSGKIYQATWAGISYFDGSLGLSIKECTFTEAAQVFSDKNETAEITYSIDGERETVYEGYTVLKGINIYGADTNVTLQKGSD